MVSSALNDAETTRDQRKTREAMVMMAYPILKVVCGECVERWLQATCAFRKLAEKCQRRRYLR